VKATLFVLLAVSLFSSCSTPTSGPSASPWGLEAKDFVVAADHPLASKAGARMLEEGGNVVDAAAAASFALAVTRPESAGLGGGGFMLLYLRWKDPVLIDYRETAPSGVSARAYLDAKGGVVPGKTVRGPWAVGVPGHVRGVSYALSKYGTKSLAEVLAPAIELAESGFPVDRHLRESMEELSRDAAGAPMYREISRVFLKEGKPYAEGEILRQPDLARTLRLLAKNGPDEFYRGSLGKRIYDEVHGRGGPLKALDLERYEVREREPLRGRFRGYEVYSAPPPSSGGACLLQILDVMDSYTTTPPVPLYFHALAEAMKHAFADRAAVLGDPDAHPEVGPDVAAMLSSEHIARIRKAIVPGATRDAARCGKRWLKDDGGTTHYSVLDRDGNAVAATETVNLGFGSLLVPPGTGVVLNDELDDFAVKTGVPNEFGLFMSERNLIQAGQRPLSSMSPTVLAKDGRAVLAVGASGGPRIITATLQTLLNIVELGMRPDEAVAAPRIHHQWSPDRLYMEDGIRADAFHLLQKSGHKLESFKSMAGAAQAAYSQGGRLFAASDPRKGGRPAGR